MTNILESNEFKNSEQKENDDTILFSDENDGVEETDQEIEKWKILIVDDEPEIHKLTKMVLTNFNFEGKSLEFISAYSGQEAKRAIEENPDTAVILLDVVMETDDSGLTVVKYIREELKNNLVRIVLRTGQPGQAPEQKVIMDYDINDYKEKTELTMSKLFTTVVSSLRSYRDIIIIENNKKGLEEIIKASPTLFESRSMKRFASGVLTQLTSILQLDNNAAHFKSSSLTATKNKQEITILSGTGAFSQYENKEISQVVPEDVLKDVKDTFQNKKSKFFTNHFTSYFQSKAGSENVIYLKGAKKLTDWDRYLIEVYSSNVSAAFENIYLNEEIESTQKEMIFTLGELVDTRSKETGYHVKRVAEYSKLLASLYGLSEENVNLLYLASPMHDVGKIGIPDSILNKPGKLTVQEFKYMKTHTNLGYEMLKHSNRPIMKTAAIISLQHHEKYNGTGYPNGLKGEEIHITGRITAIADVFDALSIKRVYKKAWPLEEILEYIKKERGKHFDPVLVDIFLKNADDFLQIRDQYSDSNFLVIND